MNFRRGSSREDLEINLIPMIDVLLVILIFLMVTTTYSRFSELKINLPKAEANKLKETPNEINVAVDAAGHYAVNRTPLNYGGVDSLAEAMRRAAAGAVNPVVIINADGNATHQSVINVMEAARLDGYSHITFTTQTTQ